MTSDREWPELPLEAWEDTCRTLHLWTQIVGKIRLARTPWINHSWHVPLYVTARGLTTSPIPLGGGVFEIEFDFVGHELVIETNGGARRVLPLRPQPVAEFYRRLLDELDDLGISVTVHGRPNEIENAVPFTEDREHASYDAAYAGRFWNVLVRAHPVFQQFRARFIGKTSPIHFFWGGFDLAVTRFSGRPAPTHPGGIPNLPDWITREAYSHEVSSAGFWPGGGPLPYPLFYSYAYPQPDGFEAADVQPADAFYSTELGEFVLPYEAVATADSPDQTLLAFLQSTYEAAAALGQWDRPALERDTDPRREFRDG